MATFLQPLFITLVVAIFFGCVPVPFKMNEPIEDQHVETITSLKKEQLDEQLGQPKVSYSIGEKEYLVYEYPEEWGTFPVMHPVGYLYVAGLAVFISLFSPDGSIAEPEELAMREEWSSACLMITLHKGEVEKADITKYDSERGCEAMFRRRLISLVNELQGQDGSSVLLLKSIFEQDLNKVKGVSTEDYFNTLHNIGPEEMYRFSKNTKGLERFMWLCGAADRGYAESRYIIGRFYQEGLEGLAVNFSKSCYWYYMAAESGHPYGKPAEENLRRVLSVEENRQVDERISHWKPGECMRELASDYSAESEDRP